MQYLMTDLHQRFIGSLNRNTPLAIGETLQVGEPESAKSYTVVSIDSSRSRDRNIKAVTVIANSNAQAKSAE